MGLDKISGVNKIDRINKVVVIVFISVVYTLRDWGQKNYFFVY